MEPAIYTTGWIGSSETSAAGAAADRLLLTIQGDMAIQLGLAESGTCGLGLRHDMERRIGSRRACTRGTPERRRTVRRRARLRSLVFTSIALALPHTLRHATVAMPSGPRVWATIDSVVAVKPSEAYEGIIREACA